MQQPTRLALNAAAWFFVGHSDTSGAPKNVAIETPFRIGRSPESDLCLPCHSVSGLHALIIEENGSLWLQDQNSTNGTYLNGQRVDSKKPLQENDTVQFGTTVFQISRLDSDDSEFDAPSSGSEEDSDKDELQRLLSGGVVPFFQPILNIEGDKQKVVGFEVLGRSQLFGLRTPEQMFAVASRMEMEAELSRVLRKQGIDVADKSLPDEFALFVNTHPAEIECMGLQESLFQIRKDYPRRSIVVEVHESILNDEARMAFLRKDLSSQGIQLAFHGFGGGRIDLAQLSEAAPEIVKFDVKLIQGIDKASSKRQQFVGSLVRMVTDLGITPLAEWIERPSEHETLRQLGFRLGQGFHYGRPSPISECLPKSVSSASSEPLVKSFLAEPKATKVQVETSSAVGDQSTPEGPRDSEWLLQQPEHHYTIQVLSAISEQRANEHIAMQDNPEDFAVFCKQGKTRMLYIVVSGSFVDRTAAKAASSELANASVSPWIRMFSSVHAEIRSGQ